MWVTIDCVKQTNKTTFVHWKGPDTVTDLGRMSALTPTPWSWIPFPTEGARVFGAVGTWGVVGTDWRSLEHHSPWPWVARHRSWACTGGHGGHLTGWPWLQPNWPEQQQGCQLPWMTLLQKRLKSWAHNFSKNKQTNQQRTSQVAYRGGCWGTRWFILKTAT